MELDGFRSAVGQSPGQSRGPGCGAAGGCVMPDLFMERCAVYARDHTLRVTLHRRWDDGPTVCYIGHNPSTAGHEVDDPTSRAWVHHARHNGFGGYVAVNLYPFRSPNPAECRRWADWENNGPDWYARDDLHRNVARVAEVAKEADRVVACWGNLPRDPMWVDHIIEAIQTGVAPWPDIYCLGTTNSGAPKHPMARGKHRIARDQEFVIWRRADAS